MGLFKKKRVQSMDSMLNGVNLPVMDKPQSVIAEQFKTIKTNINFMGIDKSMKTVAFISANISEGKSTVSANVAVASALEGKRVLMIDADFRRPTLHSTFNVSNRVGLTNLLTDDTWRQD
ncbi:MAG: exopolysaccharide biosynthesis protein, partial [Limosilactobacillus sp.]|nr:exopolysaccharide biosynthesis protein [Limosilactobacillus sp.]